MTFPKRLNTKQREDLYEAEAAKAKASGRGELPICNICHGPIDGVRQAWDASHDPMKPRWLGGEITGIAHRKCNRQHNHRHDSPLFHKSKRQRQKNIGARVSAYQPLIGTHASGWRHKISGGWERR